ncbi:ECF transporter S component [Kineosporia sp. A_224]|uniref:ECF transporter S component n=1 Tax=Kineosporia sp. A_224 TaxID=1962180 RepID=UPI000B4AD7F4|nr:ECF transporter S component [Kineosporia sp. A_224]
MSTTDPRSNLPARDPRVVAATGAAAALGLAVYLVGLPASVSLFGTPLADLTLPAALFVAFAGTALAAAVLTRTTWRVVDLVVASVLGVAGGLLFAVWNVAVWPAASGALAFYPPASAVLVGVWLLPAVLGGLVVRKPGAAVYTELVAATISAFIGNQWGFATVWYGLVEGLGAEFVLAVLLYRRFGLGAAIGAGLGAGVAVGLMDSLIYYPTFSAGYKIVYVALAMLSGAVIAGVGSAYLTKALARTGALAPLASGRTAERV